MMEITLWCRNLRSCQELRPWPCLVEVAVSHSLVVTLLEARHFIWLSSRLENMLTWHVVGRHELILPMLWADQTPHSCGQCGAEPLVTPWGEVKLWALAQLWAACSTGTLRSQGDEMKGTSTTSLIADVTFPKPLGCLSSASSYCRHDCQEGWMKGLPS